MSDQHKDDGPDGPTDQPTQGRQASPALTPVTAGSVTVDPFSGLPSVVLRDEGGRSVSVAIGVGEAAAITAVLGEIRLERPQAHDLMKQVIVALGGEFVHAEIRSLAQHSPQTFIVLRDPAGHEQRLPARPSDAIALALRMGGKILIAEKLLSDQAPLWNELDGVDRIDDLARPRRPSRRPVLYGGSAQAPWPLAPTRRPKWKM